MNCWTSHRSLQVGTEADALRVDINSSRGCATRRPRSIVSVDILDGVVPEEIKVFISYSWETAEHKTWVQQLAIALHEAPGIHVVFDDFEMYGGADLAKFMDRIVECDRVVAICTPTYVERVNESKQASGYEGALIKAELVEDMGVNKFIPVLRIGEQRPKCLSTKIYVDFRDDGTFDQKVRALLDAIKGRPPLPRPQKRESKPLLTPEQKHTIPVNRIPAELLNRLGTDQVVVLCNEDGHILGTADFDPFSLREIEGLESLSDLRRKKGVYSITMSVMRLTPSVISDATNGFEHREQIASELRTLVDRKGELYVVYVVIHFNHEPLEEMTVFIGGDCYRRGGQVNDLKSVLTRNSNLAQAMIRKAVMVFPDIPALHGGKKGEWIIVDRSGRRIEEISDAAIIALGTLIIPTGIKFINRYKEQRASSRPRTRSVPTRRLPIFSRDRTG